jgi:hypothetical protein
VDLLSVRYGTSLHSKTLTVQNKIMDANTLVASSSDYVGGSANNRFSVASYRHCHEEGLFKSLLSLYFVFSNILCYHWTMENVIPL